MYTASFCGTLLVGRYTSVCHPMLDVCAFCVLSGEQADILHLVFPLSVCHTFTSPCYQLTGNISRNNPFCASYNIQLLRFVFNLISIRLPHGYFQIKVDLDNFHWLILKAVFTLMIDKRKMGRTAILYLQSFICSKLFSEVLNIGTSFSMTVGKGLLLLPFEVLCCLIIIVDTMYISFVFIRS